MRCAGEALGDRIEKNQRERNRREQKSRPINGGCREQKRARAENQQDERRQFWYEQVTRGSTWVTLIKRPINEPVEEHRCRARKDHAGDDQQKNSERWPAIGGGDKRAKSKRQRENRVREADQSKKTSNRPALNLCHGDRPTLLRRPLFSPHRVIVRLRQ